MKAPHSAFASAIVPLLVLMLSLGGSAVPGPARQATAGAEPRHITVSGEAQVKVPPDEVILTLGVETNERSLLIARQDNDAIVKRVLAMSREHGIEPQYVQTDHISIEPRYSESYGRRDFIGYFVRQTIVITIKDIARFEDVLGGALEAGVNYVHGVDFRTTELRKYRDQARALALQAAREKAQAMTQELGQQVGEPTNVVEEQTGWWSSYGSWWGSRYGAMSQNVVQETGGAAAPEGALAPGQITVTARVSVTFLMEQSPGGETS